MDNFTYIVNIWFPNLPQLFNAYITMTEHVMMHKSYEIYDVKHTISFGIKERICYLTYSCLSGSGNYDVLEKSTPLYYLFKTLYEIYDYIRA